MIAVHNKNEILQILVSNKLIELLTDSLVISMKSEYLKWYQALFFYNYNSCIISAIFRAEYIFNLMENGIVTLSDLIVPLALPFKDHISAPKL